MNNSYKPRILSELRKLTEPADFAQIATMIDAGQGWFELPNPVTVWTAPGESDYDTLVSAIAEVQHPDILRSLVEFFDEQNRYAEPPDSAPKLQEPPVIYGLSPEQNEELERRLELHHSGKATYVSWSELRGRIKNQYGI